VASSSPNVCAPLITVTSRNEHCLRTPPSTPPHLVFQSTALLLFRCGGAEVCCYLFDHLLFLCANLRGRSRMHPLSKHGCFQTAGFTCR